MDDLAGPQPFDVFVIDGEARVLDPRQEPTVELRVLGEERLVAGPHGLRALHQDLAGRLRANHAVRRVDGQEGIEVPGVVRVELSLRGLRRSIRPIHAPSLLAHPTIRSMRVIISVDMEGATGVCHRQHLLPGGDDYQRARGWLTGDVNAAVRGAFLGGASEILVADGHGTMRNILLDDLDPRARLLTGPAQPGNRPLAQLGALAHDRFDAAMLVGHHTRAGTPGGLLAHTWIGMVVQEIRLNERPASEAMLNMAILGHYGIPVVMASGADDFCTQMREDFGDAIALAEVKQTLGPTAVVTLPLAEAQERIVAAAQTGVAAGGEPYVLEAPIGIEVDVHRDAMRERALELGAEPVGRLGFRYSGADVISVVEQVWRTLVHITREDTAFLR